MGVQINCTGYTYRQHVRRYRYNAIPIVVRHCSRCILRRASYNDNSCENNQKRFDNDDNPFAGIFFNQFLNVFLVRIGDIVCSIVDKSHVLFPAVNTHTVWNYNWKLYGIKSKTSTFIWLGNYWQIFLKIISCDPHKNKLY